MSSTEQSSEDSKNFQWRSLSFQVVPTKQLADLHASTTATDGINSIRVLSSRLRNATEFKGRMQRRFDSSMLKGCKFVLLDPYVIEVTDDYEKVTGTFHWEICETQVDRCVEYIRDHCTDKRVFLVCSGSLGAQVVPRIHDCPNLYGIYVFCGNFHYHEQWTSKYDKIRIVCNDDKSYLVPQLAVDVAQTNLEWATDLLQKGSDKAKAKKKLEHALENVENYLCGNPDPELKKEIKRKLEEC